MRPYLAILKDSVREAVRSRTLPFLLLFFTAVLVAVAPIGLRDETAWRLESGDVLDAPLLTARLRRDAAREGEQPGDRVLERLPPDLRDLVLHPPEGGADDLADGLRDALNADVLPSADLYDEAAFADVDLSGRTPGGFGEALGGAGGDDRSEVERLLEEGPADLSDARRSRFNRLLVNAAFPQTLAPPAAEKTTMTYAGYELPEELTEAFAGPLGLQLDRSGVQFVAKLLMSVVASNIAGPIGVLIAVLVTASLIPQTFEGGAIDLLLSKPVNRSLAFLTKFGGGCVFVGLAGLYLCGGLWLIAGLRLGVWDGGLVAASGVLVTEFAVIYSVSAAAGVLWRNPIVCIMLAAFVWAVSWALNLTYGLTDQYFTGNEPAAVVEAGERDDPFVATNSGTVLRWDPTAGEWNPALYQANLGQPTAVPVYNLSGPFASPDGGELRAVEIRQTVGGRPGEPAREAPGSRRYYTATADGDWAGVPGPVTPPGTAWLLTGQGGEPLFAGPRGVYRLRLGDAAVGGETGGGFFGGFARRMAEQFTGDFEPVIEPPRENGEPGRWKEPFAAAADPTTERIVVYTDGALLRFDADGSPAGETRLYEPVGEANDARAPAALPAAVGGAAFVLTADGTGKRVAADGAVTDFAPVPGERPAEWRLFPDGGSLLLRTHDGSVWLGDATGRGEVIDGDASAAGFAADGGLWVGASGRRVTKLTPGDWDAAETIGPRAGWWELTYRFVLTPLHYLLPDTSSLGDVMAGLFTDADDTEAFGEDLDLREPVTEFDTVGPLIHNLAFMAAILLLTCWHVSRTDF